MHRIWLCTAAIACAASMIGSVSVVVAATPGLNLGWEGCATTASSGNRNFSCDGQPTAVRAIQGTFVADFSIPNIAVCVSWLELGFAGPVPDYWKTDPSSCNGGAITLANPVVAAPCSTPNLFDPAVSGGGYEMESASPNHLRFRIAWANGAYAPPPVVAGRLYPAFRLLFDPEPGVTNGCSGCEVPACLWFSRLEVIGFNPGEDYLITSENVRSWCTWQNGGGVLPCPSAVPTTRPTWGAIKALYR